MILALRWGSTLEMNKNEWKLFHMIGKRKAISSSHNQNEQMRKPFPVGTMLSTKEGTLLCNLVSLLFRCNGNHFDRVLQSRNWNCLSFVQVRMSLVCFLTLWSNWVINIHHLFQHLYLLLLIFFKFYYSFQVLIKSFCYLKTNSYCEQVSHLGFT